MRLHFANGVTLEGGVQDGRVLFPATEGIEFPAKRKSSAPQATCRRGTSSLMGFAPQRSPGRMSVMGPALFGQQEHQGVHVDVGEDAPQHQPSYVHRDGGEDDHPEAYGDQRELLLHFRVFTFRAGRQGMESAGSRR